MWIPHPQHHPHVCAACGTNDPLRGPFWQIGTVAEVSGPGQTRTRHLYIDRVCLLIACFHPDGPLPGWPIEGLEDHLAQIAADRAELAESRVALMDGAQRIAHLERVVDEYEQAEQFDIDALAAKLAERLAPSPEPEPPAEPPKRATRARKAAS